MKKLIIVAAALFAMSAFAEGTTDAKPADTATTTKEAPAATTAKPKKAHKDHKAAKGEKKAEKPAADAPATGEAK